MEWREYPPKAGRASSVRGSVWHRTNQLGGIVGGYGPEGRINIGEVAVGVGFEPTEDHSSTVFKTAAFDHSASPPNSLTLCHESAHYSHLSACIKPNLTMDCTLFATDC